MGRHRKKPPNGTVGNSSNGRASQVQSSNWSRKTINSLRSSLSAKYLLVPGVLAIIATPIFVRLNPGFLDSVFRQSPSAQYSNGGWRLADAATLAKYDSKTCHVDRRYSHDLTDEEFNRVYRHKKPVIVVSTLGAADWTDPTKWTVNNLKSAYGRWSVRSGNSRDIVRQGGSGNIDSSFGHFVDSMLASTGMDNLGEPYYMFDREFYNSSGLPETIKPPKYFAIKNSLEDSIFFLGASGSGVSFHQHAEAWNGVVYGRKRWFLYSKDVTPPGGVYPGFTHMEWFTSVYPQLEPKDRPLECVQEAGEIFYLPEGFYHGTVNMGDTIAVGIQKKLATTEYGRLFYEFGDLEKKSKQPGANQRMVDVLRKLLAIVPDNMEVTMKLGSAYRNVDDYQAALYHLKRAVEKDPLFVVAWLDLAKVYEGLGDLSTAEDCYLRAQSTNSSLWDIWAFYGDFLLRQNRPKEAVTMYKKGISLKPDMMMFWKMLRQAQEEIGDYEGLTVSQSHIDSLNKKP